MQYWPLAPGKAIWESRYYSRKPSNLREDFAAQYSLALNRDTVMEDNLCLEKQQVAMESGAKPFIQFGEQEVARSEEHTSELQSLMRISYAVFCLKKNIKQHTNPPLVNYNNQHIT